MDNKNITLRKTEVEDLSILFEIQLDAQANYIAAFTSKDYADKTAFIEKHTKLLNEPTVNNQTILLDKIVVGSVAKFVMFGDNEITYWIDGQYWGKGIATKALKDFLLLEANRPIFGRVAFDNLASQKVLEKCGFIKVGSDKSFANARQTEIEEYIYKFT